MKESGDTLISSILADIRSDILSAKLQPGQKLKIDELRQRYGTSGSTVREALSQLCTDELVVHMSQRGFRVAAVSLEDFDDLVACRCRLDTMALGDAIDEGGHDWEEKVVVELHRLSRIARSMDSTQFAVNPKWERQHKFFHMALLDGCRSIRLKRFCGQLFEQAVRYRAIADIQAYPTRNILEEHQRITDLAITRRRTEALQALETHYRTTGKYLRQILSKRHGWQESPASETAAPAETP